ncbi:MAG: two-component system sensor histidine kinase NtrB, partial [Opitutaceae bacterium]
AALQPEHAEAFSVFAQQVRAHLENRRTRESLRLSEQNLSITLDSIGEGVIATDVAGRVRRMNPIAERLCGWTMTEAEGRPLHEVWRVVSGADRASSNYASPIPSARFELPPDSVLIGRAGSEHVLASSIAPILEPGGAAAGLVAVFRDVTVQRRAEAERRKLEEELQRSQKMETLGTLAGGIAHDFNNVLAGVLGCVETALNLLPAGHGAREHLELSSAGIFRARDVVRRLLLFARRMPGGAMVPIDLNKLVADAVPLLRAALPSSVALSADATEAGMIVRGDETQLQQVLTNLCVNAAQAMEGRPGLVRIRVRRSGETIMRPEGGAAAPSACLAVEDDG